MNNGHQKNINFTFENLLQDKGYKIKYDKWKISIIKEKGKMKKFIAIISFLVIANNCQANLFGIDSKLFNKTMTDIKGVQAELKAGINDNNIQTKLLNDNLIKIDTRIGQIQNTLNAQAQAQIKIQAGVDKSLSNQAGRDMTTTTTVTNDPMILKYIIGGLLGVIMFLLRDSMANRKWLQNVILSNKKKDDKISNLKSGRVKV